MLFEVANSLSSTENVVETKNGEAQENQVNSREQLLVLHGGPNPEAVMPICKSAN
jgi:hypothetical protein